MEQKRKEENVREENHEHPPREGCGKDHSQETLPQKTIKLLLSMNLPVDDGNKMEFGKEIVQPIVDGGYYRKTVNSRKEWSSIITTFEQHRGLERGDYNSCEEDFESDSDGGKAVGPCGRDYGHIGPDEEDRRYEYNYGRDDTSDDILVTREEFRNYKRPPFLMPNTTQRKYYETALTGLWVVKQKAQAMWKHVKDLRFRDGSIAEFIENPVKRVLFDIKFVMARVYNTLETLQYDTKRLNLKDASKDPDTVGKSVEPIWDMPRIIARLFHLVLTTRYQVVETERYMEESKEWLTADDWIEASCKLRCTVTSLRDLRYKLKLTYPEGDLVKYAELFWFTNNCDVAITDMDHRIDQVSERIIKEYEVNGLLVNIDDEDRGWLKKYARQHQYFTQGSKFNCPACEDTNSRGFHWRRASNISLLCMSKRPGSTSANNAEKCQAQYDRSAFSKHLKTKGKCIYHRLSQGVEEMEQELGIKYGTRVILYFKTNNTSYKKMHNVICREARTIPIFLMVGGNSNLEYRKWAIFYMDGERANLLRKNINENPALWDIFETKLTDRMWKRPMSGGRDWNPSMPDAETMLTYDDVLDLTFSISIRAMKGDSIATAINTNFFSIADSSNWAKRTRMDDSNEEPDWERLDDVKIHTNSYKTQEKTLRDVPPGVPTGRGHP